MITYEGIDRNFQFMVLEVRKQLDITYGLIREPSESKLRTILSRDNYIDTLKGLIEKKCISYFRHNPTLAKSSANLATAVSTITVNLERIADFCVNIASHVERLSDPSFLERFEFHEYFRELLGAMDIIDPALSGRDTALALRVCRTESALDALYLRDFTRIRDALRSGRDTDDLLCSLYISHYLERIGDALLNVGEAILFAVTGEKLKLHEYTRLQETLSAAQPDASIADYSIEFSWETHSGNRIAKVEDKRPAGDDMEGVFKKGHADKLARERINIERWEKLWPGLPPKVLGFQDAGEDAGLLLEFLDGYTIRDIILNGDGEVLDSALSGMEKALDGIWRAPRGEEEISAGFVDQASARLDDVFHVHPEFAGAHYKVGSLTLDSLEDLLDRARRREALLAAPFSVFIHGDFNADNVIFNHRTRQVHFIDLHRSRASDYVQDASVFLVSNFRLPIPEGPIRDLLNGVNVRFHGFVSTFAAQAGDTTFSARLALGLARSFITSTRFEVDPQFAKVMYDRAVYLLSRIADHPDDAWDSFHLNEEVLEY